MMYLLAFLCSEKNDVDSSISEILKAGGPLGLKTHFLIAHAIFMYH